MISVEKLRIEVGTFRLSDISFEVPTGQHAVLMGKTGCGKTTILEAICGLKGVRSGTIRLMGRDVTRTRPAERGIGFVPQDGALFTTMTVRKQLAFSPHIHRWPRTEIDKRVDELAELLGIEQLLDRKPHGLSGGEAQRVAIGRALASRPDVLCLDEPMSALDDETRSEMYDLLKSVQAATGVTSLHITHNVGEAKHLGDKLFFLKDGKVGPADQAKVPADHTTHTE